HTTTASASGLDDAPVTFTTTALAARLSLLTEPSASGSSGIAFAQQPVLQLAEPGGDPIARGDVAVTVQIASGGGTLSGETTAISDGSGRVTFTGLLIRGTPGVRTLIFAAEGFTPVTSPPIAIGVGTAASIAATAGGDQAATVGSAVPVAPAVVVRDADGNLVGGVAVTFTVASGGGSVSGGALFT
ncbi:MAG: hypothetical protein ACREMG_06970, partial [Gemmatimonadales bacterium]